MTSFDPKSRTTLEPRQSLKAHLLKGTKKVFNLWKNNLCDQKILFVRSLRHSKGVGGKGRVNYGLDEAVCVELSPDY